MRNFIKENILYLLFISSGIMLVYFPVLNNQFLDLWDDGWMVKNQYTESGFTLSNLIAILVEFYHGQYSPFNQYFYLLVYNISNNYNSFIFHLSSLILHITNSILVFFLIKILLTMRGDDNFKNIKIISISTAFIFAIHPINVEAVAWISASKVLIFSFFYLLAAISFLHFLNKSKFRYFVATLLFFTSSFLSKEQAVSFPFMLLLFLWFLKYDIFSKRSLWYTIPFFLFSIFFGIITLISQKGYTSFHFNDYSLVERFIYASYSLVEYFCKCIFPVKLSYLYPFFNLPGEPLPIWLLMYPLFLSIVLIAFYKVFSKWPFFLFGILFFIINIALVLHIIPLSRFAVIADRYVYIPSIGFAFLLSYHLLKFYKKSNIWKRYFLIILFSIYIFYIGIYAHMRTYTWYDSNTLKSDLIELLEKRNKYQK